ncbi:L-aspartate aminotransferase apoenzyme [Arboricoccus pini]|uniref:Aminotransferase n=1 Tax=Arboricoccus pini TaxID=1963835 RepID=A0A212QW90_9PROT|nr:pyridoxal phosphate-dependent aminotransferase [Arboricoccus pini]SNB63951.1 L-aspartate aminotransferase apoenzyme [Arboricoccus pini]
MPTPPLAARAPLLGGAESDAWTVHFLGAQRRAAGEDIILLSIGDPDAPTPAPIVAAAKAGLDRGNTKYNDLQGQLGLRAAIATWNEKLTGATVTPEQVTVFSGAQCALFAACQCLLDPGSEVIGFDPMYVTYPATIAAAGGVLRRVPLDPDRGFRPDLGALEAAVTPRTRAVLMNFPNNPTGAVLGQEDLAAIAAFCTRHDLWLISDEVYAALVFDGRHLSPLALPGMAARTVIVSSLSKSHAMTGWRVGWTIGPPELTPHTVNLALCMLYGQPGFIQDAATAGIVGALEGKVAEIASMRETYKARRDRACALFKDLPGCRLHVPTAGMFIMLDIRSLGWSATRFALQLLDEEGLAVLPGDPFGKVAEGHLRISLTASEERISEAAARLRRFLARHRKAA